MAIIQFLSPRVGAHPDVAKQAAWDAIAAVAHLGHGPGVTGGEGGFFRDTSLTIPCTGNDECFGLKSFGTNKPSTHNLPYNGNTSLTPANALVWYKDLTSTNIGPRYIDRGNWDRYLEFYNGPPNTSYFETAGSFTAKIQPIDFVIALRYLPQTHDEGTGHIKMVNPPATQHLTMIDDFSPQRHLADGVHYPFYEDCVTRVLVRADNTWQVWINGVSVGSGTGQSFSTTEWIWGTASHVLGCHMRYNIVKFGEFTAGELTTIYTNSQLLWPWAQKSIFPFIAEIFYGDASTFDSSAKTWTPGRGKTVVFSGGTGTEGATKYMWYYFDSADSTLFPSADGVLTNHRQIPSSVNISTIASGNSVTQISIDGFNLMSSPVSFITSSTATADAIVTNINANQTKYLAERRSTSILFHPIGIDCNNYSLNSITITASGFTPTKLDAPRSASLLRTTYAGTGQIFSGVAGSGTIKLARITYPFDSVGTAGPPIPTAWIIDNIA